MAARLPSLSKREDRNKILHVLGDRVSFAQDGMRVEI